MCMCMYKPEVGIRPALQSFSTLLIEAGFLTEPEVCGFLASQAIPLDLGTLASVS